LFTPRNRIQLWLREHKLRLVSLPVLAHIAKRVLNGEGERL
jgi:hypothetical protein